MPLLDDIAACRWCQSRADGPVQLKVGGEVVFPCPGHIIELAAEEEREACSG